MSCENCVTHVTAAFRSLPGVADARVLLESGQAVVRMEKGVSMDAINTALQEAGHYSAWESNEAGNTSSQKKKRKQPAFFRFFRHEKPCCQ